MFKDGVADKRPDGQPPIHGKGGGACPEVNQLVVVNHLEQIVSPPQLKVRLVGKGDLGVFKGRDHVFGEVVEWWNGGVVEWWSGGVVEWWSGGVVEWWSGGVVEWWSGGVVEWWSGGVVEWWSGGVVKCGVEVVEWWSGKLVE